MGFNVLVISAAVNAQLEKAVEEKIAQLIAPFKSDYPIVQFAARDLALLQERMQAIGFNPSLVSLDTYPNIRNIQLIIPHVMGSEIIIALDDDEIVSPSYMQQASAFVGSKWRGQLISGVAGIYLNGNGEWLLPENPPTGNLFIDKVSIMNAGARSLMEDAQSLVKSPVSYGGNMIFHRDLFTQISFDPGITRGEDIDYLITAHIGGYKFWFDKTLAITHLPPMSHKTSPYAKLREDVIRFIYEREKLRHAEVDPRLFDPYPGRFLDTNLESHAFNALKDTATPEDIARFGSPQEVLTHAGEHSQKYIPRFFNFIETWPRLMREFEDDKLLQEYWHSKMEEDSQ